MNVPLSKTKTNTISMGGVIKSPTAIAVRDIAYTMNSQLFGTPFNPYAADG